MNKLIYLFLTLAAFSVTAQSNWVNYDNFNDNSFDNERWDSFNDGADTPTEINGAIKLSGSGSNEPYNNISVDQDLRSITGISGKIRLDSSSDLESGVEVTAHLGQYIAFAILEKKADGSVVIAFELEDPDSDEIIQSFEFPATLDTDYTVSIEVAFGAVTFSSVPAAGGTTTSKTFSGSFPTIHYCAFGAYYDIVGTTGSYLAYVDDARLKKGSVSNWTLADGIDNNNMSQWTPHNEGGADAPSATQGKIKLSGSGNTSPYSQVTYKGNLDGISGIAADLKLASSSGLDSGVEIFCGLTANAADYLCFNSITRELNGSYKIEMEVEDTIGDGNDIYSLTIDAAADTYYNLAIVTSDTHIIFLVNGEQKGSFALAGATINYAISSAWYDTTSAVGSYEAYMDSFYTQGAAPTSYFIVATKEGNGSISPSEGLTPPTAAPARLTPLLPTAVTASNQSPAQLTAQSPLTAAAIPTPSLTPVVLRVSKSSLKRFRQSAVLPVTASITPTTRSITSPLILMNTMSSAVSAGTRKASPTMSMTVLSKLTIRARLPSTVSTTPMRDVTSGQQALTSTMSSAASAGTRKASTVTSSPAASPPPLISTAFTTPMKASTSGVLISMSAIR